MTGPIAGLRALRKPALALVAAAGLVAWGGGPGAVEAIAAGRAPIVPGRATITVLGHAESPALGSGAAAVAGLMAEPGKRQQLRLNGDGGPQQPADNANSFRIHLPSGDAGVRGRALVDVARARATLRSAPSTGPPSFPST